MTKRKPLGPERRLGLLLALGALGSVAPAADVNVPGIAEIYSEPEWTAGVLAPLTRSAPATSAATAATPAARTSAAGRAEDDFPALIPGVAEFSGVPGLDSARTPSTALNPPPPEAPAAPADQPERPTKLEPAQAWAEVPEYRIRTGDVLSISIPYEENSEQSVPVRPDGRITYLFNIELQAAGLTYRELNARLREELSHYYKNPRVTVIGTSFAGNSVFVMGPVGKPGPHTIQSDTRLLDVLAAAGVLSVVPQVSGTDLNDSRLQEVVNLKEAYLARGERILEVDFYKLLLEKDMSQNIPLLPKDFIFIPSNLSTAKRVFIAGLVGEPLAYNYNDSITFLEAVVRAGDTLSANAYGRKCLVVRGQSHEVIEVNYAEIVMGRAPDLPLLDRDIVYIPERPLSYTSRTISTVVTELLAPFKAVLDDGYGSAQSWYQRDWQLRARGKARNN